MKRARVVCLSGAVLIAMGASAVASAAETYTADLVGREEVPPVSTEGRGFFIGSLNDAETTLAFVMTYFALEGTPAVAHIHFGPRGVAAGVVAFLCGGGGKPACPANGVQVAGTVVAADVIGPTGQGITAGEFDEFVRGLRGGDMYVNVHSNLFPNGEVRGQLR